MCDSFSRCFSLDQPKERLRQAQLPFSSLRTSSVCRIINPWERKEFKTRFRFLLLCPQLFWPFAAFSQWIFQTSGYDQRLIITTMASRDWCVYICAPWFRDWGFRVSYPQLWRLLWGRPGAGTSLVLFPGMWCRRFSGQCTLSALRCPFASEPQGNN